MPADRLYDVVGVLPELDDPVMFIHLDGFIDAGSAGRTAVEQLRRTSDVTELVRFDVDTLIDHRSRRPMVTFSSDHYSQWDGHSLTLSLLRDAMGAEFLLLDGPEPDVRWEGFTTAVIELVERLGVRLTLTLHGIPMAVPHTRPTGITMHATRSDLVTQPNPWGDDLQVPGSVAALLEMRLGRSGHDAIGWAAHVPHYLAGSTYPDAARVLLERAGDVAGLVLPLGELIQQAEETEQRVQLEVVGQDEVVRVVRALEVQYDAFVGGEGRGLLDPPKTEELPSADELGADFERFLAEQFDQGSADAAAEDAPADDAAPDAAGDDGRPEDGERA